MEIVMHFEKLEEKVDLDKLIPDVLDLVSQVVDALKDGKLSLIEGIRLGQAFLRLVKNAVK